MGVAPYAVILVQHQDGDLDRVEEVQDVGVHHLQVLVSAVQLVVHRGELLVGRLELLLGGLQLLVEALELLVGRNRARRWQRRARRWRGRAPQSGRRGALLGGELLLERPSKAARRPHARARAPRADRAGPLLEEHHEGSLPPSEPCNGITTRSQRPAGPFAPEFDALLAHGRRRLARLLQRDSQGCSETGAHHPQQLALRLPLGRLKVWASPPAELDYLHAIVDHDAGRSVPRQHQLVGVARPQAVGLGTGPSAASGESKDGRAAVRAARW